MSVTDVFDEPPSDIVLKIDFIEGEGSAARPFQIAADLIRALEQLDATLAKSVDSAIETTLVVEDLQKSSIKVYLRNTLKMADDDALKTLDWKPLVGQFLVKAKYAALRWLDDKEPKLNDLTEEVASLASQVEIHHMPLAAKPNPTRLVQSLDRLQAVKSEFRAGEGLTITLGSDEYTVDLERTWTPSDVVDVPPGDMELVAEQPMILVVRKPDMLGNTAWQFRIGKKNLTLSIEDAAWLESYHAREVTILSGDALQVMVRTVSRYSEKGELLENKQAISKVVRVIPQVGGGQVDLFDG
ncbi:MAG: hypothetical protein QM594_10095 [Niabella sp.]